MNNRKICPICNKPEDPVFKPFCSKRCADLDLGNWLGERYKIPVRNDDDEDGGPPDQDES